MALGAGDPDTAAHASGCAQCTAHLTALKAPLGPPDFVHPSALALDRLALGLVDDHTRAHAATCAQCAARLRAVQLELPIPSWVQKLEAAPRPRLTWLRPALAFGAMAAVLVFALVVPRISRGPDISPKGLGTPQAQAWVNRSGAVGRWDGTPLHPDDAVRFEVRPNGFTHLTVVELQEGRLFRVLHSAPVPPDGLSPAWAVDAEGTQEEVVVLLSKAPLSEDELERALAGEGPVWSNRWKFPKEVR
jgi:hypothetical protein